MNTTSKIHWVCLLLTACLLAGCASQVQAPEGNSSTTSSTIPESTATTGSTVPESTATTGSTIPESTATTGSTVPASSSSTTPTGSVPDTNPPATQPSGYQYDFGTRIENPTDADIQLFYNMVQNQTLGGPSFDPESADINWLMRLILDSVGSGMFHEYQFSFFEETVELYDEMHIYSRYYAADIDWVMMAVFGREPDHSQMADPGGNTYFEGDSFYRFAEENYMGNPWISVERFAPSYQVLSNGNWKFTISMETMGDYDEEPTTHNYEIEAIPMHSTDTGTYWRIVSFINHD